MSGTNPNGVWNQYGQGTIPMTGNEVLLASASSAQGATMENYTTAQLAAFVATSILPAQVSILLAAWMATLPTTLPASSGVWWNNSGIPNLTQ